MILHANMEGVDECLVKLHQRYIQEALGQSWTKESVIRKWDTWHSSKGRPFEENMRGLIEEATENPKVIKNSGLMLFMPYESFPYPKLIVHMA